MKTSRADPGYGAALGSTGVVVASAQLPPGVADTVLHSDGTDVSWEQVTPDDMDVSADVTTANSTTGHHGFLPKLGGGSTNFLRADGTWAAPGTGGGGGGAAASTGGYAIFPLDRTTVSGLDGTFGDDFTDASLNARWTRVNQASGEESYQVGPRASALRVLYSNAAVSRYIYQASPAGDWTFEASLSIRQENVNGEEFAILAVDSSGTGVGALVYNNPGGIFLTNLTAGVAGSVVASQTYANLPGPAFAGIRLWLRLRKASGVYFASYSIDGEAYCPEVSGTPSAFTLARIGIGRVLGTGAADEALWHWFDKTA